MLILDLNGGAHSGSTSETITGKHPALTAFKNACESGLSPRMARQNLELVMSLSHCSRDTPRPRLDLGRCCWT
eukprot:scaffold34709_cov189-Amphora_coffeaeformis.AAC.3